MKSKADKLARAEEANAELSALLAAERKAAKLAGAAAQKQLLGSMRRIQYMVSIMIGLHVITRRQHSYICLSVCKMYDFACACSMFAPMPCCGVVCVSGAEAVQPGAIYAVHLPHLARLLAGPMLDWNDVCPLQKES